MPKYALIDCKPVPAKLEAELRAIKAEAGATLTSCLRTQGAVDFARGKGCTLSSQRELYDGFVKGLPGFNPANPPGKSTHERRSDGVAFPRIPIFTILAYYKVGQDWGDGAHARAVVGAASRRGWRATITYPSSPNEQHHVNFRKEPILKVTPRTLKRGSKGPGVNRLRKRLHYVHRPHSQTPYLPEKPERGPFGRRLQNVLKTFQHDHGLPADGVFGPKTRAQLKVSVRRERKRRAKR